MNWMDITILAIVLLSIVLGVTRGFTKEAISLLAWVLAALLALNYSEAVSDLLGGHITQPVIRYISAFLLICIVTLLVVGLIRLMFGKFIEKSQLSKADRVLGFFFGTLRGVMMVSIIIYLLQTTHYAQQPKWLSSKLIPHFENVAVTFISFIPNTTAFHSAKKELKIRTNPDISDYLHE